MIPTRQQFEDGQHYAHNTLMIGYNWCLSCKNIYGSPVCADCFHQATYAEGLIIHRAPSEYVGNEKEYCFSERIVIKPLRQF